MLNKIGGITSKGWLLAFTCWLWPCCDQTFGSEFSSPQLGEVLNTSGTYSAAFSGWKEYHSFPGNCSMMFPADPEHISEKMAMPEEGLELKYDAYISASDKQAVFMLLIAQYPDFVDENYAQMSLEGFLNGILTHNSNNRLIFSDTLLVYGHEALDFFISTGHAYFKGRAVMVQNSLYLMAMECEIPQYDENHYKHFISSFKLHGEKAKLEN